MRISLRFPLAGALFLTLAAFPSNGSSQQPGGRVTGTVIDSTRHRPLAGAEVMISGTQLFATTNEDGRFFIPDVPAGTYTITFRHPRVDSLGIPWPSRSLTLAPGAAADLILSVPAAATAEVPAAQPERPVPQPLQGPVTTPTGPAAFVGEVLDAGTRKPVAGALLQVRGTSVRNVSDERGRFVLWGIPPGNQVLDVEMLGYANRSESVSAAAGRTTELTIPLSTQAIELDPISVEVRSSYLERTGFYERIEIGQQGTFLTRPEIEARAMATVRDLFTAIPVVRVEYRGPGRTIIQLRRTVGSADGLGCVPLFYLDGARISSDIDFLSPEVIEGMEVYAGSNAPIGYGNSCGAIMIWTRHG